MLALKSRKLCNFFYFNAYFDLRYELKYKLEQVNILLLTSGESSSVKLVGARLRTSVGASWNDSILPSALFIIITVPIGYIRCQDSSTIFTHNCKKTYISSKCFSCHGHWAKIILKKIIIILTKNYAIVI